MGGAGPMNACAVAAELGLPRVVIPRHPGVTAALGLLVSDVRHDLRRSWIGATDAVDVAALDAAVGALEDDGRARLRAAGHADGTVGLAFELDMRYRGQAYNLTVPLAARPVTEATVRAAEAAFEAAHRRAYDYTPSVTETEIVTIRARATGAVAAVAWDGHGAREGAPAATRDVWEGDAWAPYTVVERGALAPGDAVAGRTIVEQEDTTVVVPAGWHGRVADAEILILERAA
jgi:N-methylhydantoinase A